MTLRKIYATILCHCFALSLMATGQVVDVLYYDGQRLQLLARPIVHDPTLRDSVRAMAKREHADHTTANWEGYQGYWHVEEGRLFLDSIGIEVSHQENGQWHTTQRFFRGDELRPIFYHYYRRGRVEATWVSDTLRLGRGQTVYYEHMGFARYYEREWLMVVKKGHVTGVQAFENRVYEGFSLEQQGAADSLLARLPLHRYPELAGRRLVLRITLDSIADGRLLHCTVKPLFKNAADSALLVHHPLLADVELALRQIRPWQYRIIHGHYFRQRATYGLPLRIPHGATEGVAVYEINVDSQQQTIEHFGASDAWSMQTIGTWHNEDAQRQVADWLFSTDTLADGRPRGIGLSLWRFNLGAGSSEQGEASHINKDTRTECFLQPDGTYDWQRQRGQVRFLTLARERGVPRVLAFLNSPPVYFTQNGLATNTGRDGTLNLRPDCYERFAEFMADCVSGLEREHGIHVDYICPVNEPDGSWNWQGPKQEGTPATNREVARVVRNASQTFARRGLTTSILVPESSDLRCLLGVHDTSWERGNGIASYFCADSMATCVGGLSNVPRLILGHSYWTNTPPDSMKYIRMQVRDAVRRYDAAYWQTELCIMQNDTEIGGGHGFDPTMKTALYVARVIHHDLVYANACSWSWWRACGGDYKDGLLRVYNREERATDSRLLWALGNYSRFIRPGAVRHDVTSATAEDPYGLMVSAYRNQDGRWVCVVINYGGRARRFAVGLSDGSQTTWRPYQTSDAEGATLQPLAPVTGETVLPPRSITTFVACP